MFPSGASVFWVFGGANSAFCLVGSRGLGFVVIFSGDIDSTLLSAGPYPAKSE